MHHFTGVTAFSLDPYQIGHENEEGIASGAFWFYRKLGFRPVREEALALTLKEEEKLKTRKGYRTPAATLRKLAASPMILELERGRRGDWDRFQVRKIGLKAQQVNKTASDLELVLSLIPDLSRWSDEERREIGRIVQAKTASEEVTYLRLMQQHERLRSAIIQLGS